MLSIDSKGFLHLPGWARLAAITTLSAGLVIGIGILYYYLRTSPNKDGVVYNDALLVALSFVQIMAVGTVGAIIILYGETEATTKELKRRSEAFLEVHLPHSLARISLQPEKGSTESTVKFIGKNDIFGANYELTCDSHVLRLWVGVNVSRLIVIYWIATTDHGDSLKQVEKTFEFTFGGAGKVGFSTFYEQAASPNGEPIISIWSTVTPAENLLTNPAAKLFWAQDVAMMTESFWRTALRNSVSLSVERPCPL